MVYIKYKTFRKGDEKIMVIYISGKMSGVKDYNYPAFFEAEYILRRLGYDVVNPARTGVQEGWEWKDYLKKDLVDILTKNVDTVVTLEGWEDSRGARLEVHVAKELGMKVISMKEFLYSHGLVYNNGKYEKAN